MKHPEIIVQIPEPCHEDWNKMTPTEKGKFCKVCTKEVVDFSARSDEEIIKYLMNHGNLCGRFHISQLDRKLIADRKKRNHWLSYAASFLLPMALFSQEKSQKTGETIKIEKVDASQYKSLNISSLQRKTTSSTKIQQEQFIINGVIKDEAGMPLPGATVVIKGSHIGKTTDFDGKYELTVKAKDILVINYVGYFEKEIRVTTNRRKYDAILELDEHALSMVGLIVCAEPTGADAYGYISNYDRTSYPKPLNEREIKERDQRTENYFAFQRKKWLEKRARRRTERAKRKTLKNTSNK
ncbi:carboxypeptidase-like regulatory domain-containing protein [Kordia sp.]|uniref:carboxypeptidase-like regulatory domain-containing protein n=1 Tax=Kordia sp. TaxID=1965332 RepID=UPI003B594F94